MREKITFAVDANGLAYYVGVSDKMKHLLSIEEQGANIDDWPGDFPADLQAGFYSANLDVTGSIESPELHWTLVQKLTALPPNATVTRLPEVVEKEKKTRKKPQIKAAIEEGSAPQVRIRRKGEVLI